MNNFKHKNFDKHLSVFIACWIMALWNSWTTVEIQISTTTTEYIWDFFGVALVVIVDGTLIRIIYIVSEMSNAQKVAATYRVHESLK